MKGRVLEFLKKDAMLVVSVLAAVISMLITPPGKETLAAIDWKTLAILFMLLSVLDGFKHENLFQPVIRLSGHFRTPVSLSFFLIFGVFFSSMFVTNDVSLIIFVPLTIILFRAGGREELILPVIVMENIAAIRGSLLTPFGSPQNLFLFGKSGLSAGSFLWMMLPIWVGSILLLSIFILFFFRKDRKAVIEVSAAVGEAWDPRRRGKRILYFSLFVLILATIVTRTALWPYVTALVAILLLIFDRKVYGRVDYVLLLTFFCFFLFSSSIAANAAIADYLRRSVAGHEYAWSILISQVISNVPAAIVLWPFTGDLKALIYGLDSAGLVSIIGSLASVINLRIYAREYPGQGGKFILEFEKISLIFFAIILLPQLWLL